MKNKRKFSVCALCNKAIPYKDMAAHIQSLCPKINKALKTAQTRVF